MNTTFYPIVYNAIGTVWLSRKLQMLYNKREGEEFEYISRFLSSDFLKIVNNIKLNIYLMTEAEDPNLKRDRGIMYGYHQSNNMNVIVLNLTALMEKSKDLEFGKFTFLHEAYHAMQTRALNCRDVNYPDSEDNKFTAMLESSAEYFALSKITLEEQQKYIKNEYFVQYPITSLDVYENFKNGAFNNLGSKFNRYFPFYLWDRNKTEDIQLSALDILSFLDSRSTNPKNTSEFADNAYFEKLLSDYSSSNRLLTQKALLDINESFYFDDHASLVPSNNSFIWRPSSAIFDVNLAGHFDMQEKSLFNYDSFDVSKHLTVGSLTESESFVNVESFGGNFYSSSTSYNPESYLSSFPTLFSVKVNPGVAVRAMLNRRISPSQHIFDIIKSGDADGDYKFLAFNRRVQQFDDSEFLEKRNVVINLANPTGSREEAKITKKVLCKTIDVSENQKDTATTQSYIRILCPNSDCTEIKQRNYFCTKDGAIWCSVPGVAISPDKKEKYIRLNGRNGRIVSCQYDVIEGKDYLLGGALDFSQSAVVRPAPPPNESSFPGYNFNSFDFP